MKKSAVCTSLLLLIALMHMSCSSLTEANVNKFIGLHLYANETYSEDCIPLNGTDYCFIKVGDKVKFIITPAGDGMLVVNDSGEIKALLTAYYWGNTTPYEATYPNSTEIETIRNLTLEFNETRSREGYCKNLIGLDRFPCVDHMSCWRACYTPICQTMKIGGGEKFINLIWDFSNHTTEIDGNLTLIWGMLDAISDRSINDTNLVVNEISGSVNNIEDSSSEVNSNSLFNLKELGLCLPVLYNQTYLEEVKSAVTNMSMRIKASNDFENEWAEVANETRARMLLMEQRSEESVKNVSITVAEPVAVEREAPKSDDSPIIIIGGLLLLTLVIYAIPHIGTLSGFNRKRL